VTSLTFLRFVLRPLYFRDWLLDALEIVLERVSSLGWLRDSQINIGLALVMVSGVGESFYSRFLISAIAFFRLHTAHYIILFA